MSLWFKANPNKDILRPSGIEQSATTQGNACALTAALLEPHIHIQSAWPQKVAAIAGRRQLRAQAGMLPTSWAIVCAKPAVKKMAARNKRRINIANRNEIGWQLYTKLTFQKECFTMLKTWA